MKDPLGEDGIIAVVCALAVVFVLIAERLA